MGPAKELEANKNNYSYSLTLFQDTYKSAVTRLIQFFSVSSIKKYIDYDTKTKFHHELIEEILKQLRQFLRNKSMRDFDSVIRQENMEEMFLLFDEIYFRSKIYQSIKNSSLDQNQRKNLAQLDQFDVEDIEDQILDQLEAQLVKIYSEL